MSISKTLTLTSRLVVLDNTLIDSIAKNQKNDSNSKLDEVILLVDWSKIEKLNDNELIGLIHTYGFKIIISDTFTPNFSAKSVNHGVLTIEISNLFLNKIIVANIQAPIKLFVDLPGLELMLVESGEKEFFELSDYSKEGCRNEEDDIENLHAVWDAINYSHIKEEIFDCAID